ncbi:hypothetical protein MAPG_07956 [Magnaporthiopsis poae ATCC 64411]|uniref:Uncharacterized protein n=1 Tax=Magnaporthiopsis poae (strain ATCC 64411 / 73-15) TaxID=644358 RepID=A0A0C4E626_MAGP6|nr:hypothetical protein MAPG_07956 [Magnaporthiopsis poae ATCC 64411]
MRAEEESEYRSATSPPYLPFCCSFRSMGFRGRSAPSQNSCIAAHTLSLCLHIQHTTQQYNTARARQEGPVRQHGWTHKGASARKSWPSYPPYWRALAPMPGAQL